jgi:CHRD domain
MRRRQWTVVGAAVAVLVAAGLAAAGLNGNFSRHLSGDFEVPIRDTNAQGQAIFHFSDDGSSLEYKLIASNIENVFMAHIHVGGPGVNGPIGVWLYPSTAPAPGPTGAGRTDGVLVQGTITAANFVGPLAGKSMDDLVALMNGGGAYVNVHTNDGVDPPDTGPGDFPGGEIRGDF